MFRRLLSFLPCVPRKKRNKPPREFLAIEKDEADVVVVNHQDEPAGDIIVALPETTTCLVPSVGCGIDICPEPPTPETNICQEEPEQIAEPGEEIEERPETPGAQTRQEEPAETPTDTNTCQEGAGDALPQDCQEPEKSQDDEEHHHSSSFPFHHCYHCKENRRGMPPCQPIRLFGPTSSEESSDSDHSCHCEENRRDMPPFEPYFDSGESSGESSDSDEQLSEEGAPSELIWMSSLSSLFFV
ncbi:hypothetical protein XENTR_v10010725 [Xenopus tropicalis]|nr:hypothetical protein XENTR_v10010725 [Xenopus tropicalis]